MGDITTKMLYGAARMSFLGSPDTVGLRGVYGIFLITGGLGPIFLIPIESGLEITCRQKYFHLGDVCCNQRGADCGLYQVAILISAEKSHLAMPIDPATY